MLLLLAIALTVTAGPLGRPTPDENPSDDVFRPASVISLSADGPAH